LSREIYGQLFVLTFSIT